MDCEAFMLFPGFPLALGGLGEGLRHILVSCFGGSLKILIPKDEAVPLSLGGVRGGFVTRFKFLFLIVASRSHQHSIVSALVDAT